MPPTPKTVIVFRTATNKEPFTDWLNSLRDAQSRRRILRRLTRLESGNFGDCKPGVVESASYASFSALAIEFTLGKTVTRLLSCCAAVIKTASTETFGRPKFIGRSI